VILRPYQPGDAPAVHEICKATSRESDPGNTKLRNLDLVGHIYAGPYTELQPELVFVIADEDGVAGYVLGALDSVDFYRRWRAEWTPRFVTTCPEPVDTTTGNDRLLSLLYHPEQALIDAVDAYPSHLHVDLLARARRQGWGRALLLRLFDALREKGSTGVHLITSNTNTGAVAFYDSLGFSVLVTPGNAVVMGLDLTGSGRME
jgi:ribosomal protein S18 acetylase RimI-like enzyme